MLAGQPSVTDYTGLDANGKSLASGKVSPADAYQAKLATFKQQVAAGLLTGPALFKAQQSLGKEAITSQYSQQVLDFYGMSKTAQSAYFKANPQDAANLYAQAKQLDAQLNQNKFTSTPKYKYGLGTKSSSRIKVAKVPSLPQRWQTHQDPEDRQD